MTVINVAVDHRAVIPEFGDSAICASLMLDDIRNDVVYPSSPMPKEYSFTTLKTKPGGCTEYIL